eukprot:comp22212_c0_seq1/m.52486 comp22212_c0_seq1/g.52486  ORF comp22212_c0_seq1/g.52486 comp22212_c0_seq1/m.52486 type:complete len:339 (-) comp22212_c0_seq1:627-1643(-)
MPWRITRNESKPIAALTTGMRCTCPSRVGSQRDSRESVSRNTIVCAFIRSSRRFTSRSTSARCSAVPTAWPAIGMLMLWPSETIAGKISRSRSAATSALGRLPSWQSRKVNRLWRTGFEYETLLLSTNVMWRTPQAISVRATLHPKVPAPSKRHFCCPIVSRSIFGTSRHFISLRFRSTDSSARRCESMIALRSTSRGEGRPLAFASQPVTCGIAQPCGSSGSRRDSTTLPEMSPSRDNDSRRQSTLACASPHLCAASTSRLRTEPDGFAGKLELSANPSRICPDCARSPVFQLWKSRSNPASGGWAASCGTCTIKNSLLPSSAGSARHRAASASTAC